MDLLLAMHESYAIAYFERLENATDAEKKQAFDQFGARSEQRKKIYTVEGTLAKLEISGPLSRSGPDFLDLFFGYGGTSYADIISAAAELAANDAVDDVDMYINSPGGFVDGGDETYQALVALARSKNLRAINTGLMASGAYYLAVAADRIDAVSPAVETGSIGVKVAGYDFTQAHEARGIKRRVILSDGAPNKDITLTTETGRSLLQDMVNAHERIFHQRVAEGRGISVETVREDFGKGAVLVAFDPDPDQPDALDAGMIDGLLGDGMPSFASAKDKKPDHGKAAGRAAFQNFEVVDKGWDATAAIRRVRAHLKLEDKSSPEYRTAFFWSNAAINSQFAGHALAFVDVVGGKLVAVLNGINAADRALNSSSSRCKNIPVSDRPGVQRHIERYQSKWRNKQKRGPVSAMNQETQKMSALLLQLLADNPAARQEYDAELEKAKLAGLSEGETKGKAEGVKAGKAEADAEIEKRSAVVKVAMDAEKSYPKSVRELAGKVMTGDASVESLHTTIASVDAMREEAASVAAAAETAGAGGTAAAQHNQGKVGGVAETEDDFQAQVATFNQTNGVAAGGAS